MKTKQNKANKRAVKKPVSRTALKLDRNQGGSDYTLQPGHKSCWITVGSISIYILRQEGSGGVSVDLLPLDDEGDEPIDSAFAAFDDSPKPRSVSRAATGLFEFQAQIRALDGPKVFQTGTVFARASTGKAAQLLAYNHVDLTWSAADPRVEYRIILEGRRLSDEETTAARFNRPETVWTDDGRANPSA